MRLRDRVREAFRGFTGRAKRRRDLVSLFMTQLSSRAKLSDEINEHYIVLDNYSLLIDSRDVDWVDVVKYGDTGKIIQFYLRELVVDITIDNEDFGGALEALEDFEIDVRRYDEGTE